MSFNSLSVLGWNFAHQAHPTVWDKLQHHSRGLREFRQRTNEIVGSHVNAPRQDEWNERCGRRMKYHKGNRRTKHEHGCVSPCEWPHDWHTRDVIEFVTSMCYNCDLRSHMCPNIARGNGLLCHYLNQWCVIMANLHCDQCDENRKKISKILIT